MMSVTAGADGETLASGSSDNTVKLWDVASGELKQTLEGHAGGVLSVAWSPDGETLASGSEDNTVKLWEVASGELKQTLEGHARWVLSVAWSPDGETLASGSYDNTVKLWETTIVRTNLHLYLEERWCEFDPETQELTWNEPKRHLPRG